MKGNSLHDLKWTNSWNLFMNDFYTRWVSWHRISNLSWRAPSRLTVQAAWITGACLVCLGHGLPGMIAHHPWYTTPRQWTATWKTNQTTTTTTHRYVWVSWYILYMIFKGAKSLALFLQRGFGGCYGLNHMPWIFSKVTDYGDSQQGWLKLFGPRLEAVKLNMMSKWWRTTKSPKRTGGKDLHLHIFFGCEHKTHSKTKPSKIMMRDILFKEVWGYLSV